MQLVSDLQVAARFHARDDELTLTSGEGLYALNFSLRRMAALLAWEDLTRVDETLRSTGGQAAYDWITVVSFLDIRLMQMQDKEEGDAFKRIVPVRSMLDWEQAEREAADLPRFYRLREADGSKKLDLAPAPKWSGKTIRVTGVLEPEELFDEFGRTPFRLVYWDDCLALLCAAFYMAKRGQQQRAGQLFQMTAEHIKQNTGKELTPAELGALLPPVRPKEAA